MHTSALRGSLSKSCISQKITSPQLACDLKLLGVLRFVDVVTDNVSNQNVNGILERMTHLGGIIRK